MGVSASREVISSSRWAILDEISRSIWLKRQIYVDLWSFLVVSGALIYGPCLGPLFGRPDVVWSGLPRVSRSTVGIYFIHIDCKFHWDIFVTTSNLVSYIQNSLRYICNCNQLCKVSSSTWNKAHWIERKVIKSTFSFLAMEICNKLFTITMRLCDLLSLIIFLGKEIKNGDIFPGRRFSAKKTGGGEGAYVSREII